MEEWQNLSSQDCTSLSAFANRVKEKTWQRSSQAMMPVEAVRTRDIRCLFKLDGPHALVVFNADHALNDQVEITDANGKLLDTWQPDDGLTYSYIVPVGVSSVNLRWTAGPIPPGTFSVNAKAKETKIVSLKIPSGLAQPHTPQDAYLGLNNALQAAVLAGTETGQLQLSTAQALVQVNPKANVETYLVEALKSSDLDETQKAVVAIALGKSEVASVDLSPKIGDELTKLGKLSKAGEVFNVLAQKESGLEKEKLYSQALKSFSEAADPGQLSSTLSAVMEIKDDKARERILKEGLRASEQP